MTSTLSEIFNEFKSKSVKINDNIVSREENESAVSTKRLMDQYEDVFMSMKATSSTNNIFY